jgi:hypothetical protein
MSPRFLLRLEGLCVLLAAVTAYALLDHSWWLFAGALLAPDLFMAGYLAGPRVGAFTYNAGHTYAAALGLGALGYALALPLAPALALIWAAHIGMDRALGYGLKWPSSFRDTHLGSTGSGVSRSSSQAVPPSPAPAAKA